MIYVVDDDQSIRATLRAVLEDENFQVADFDNGGEMLRTLERERPELIVLDVWLDREDGLSLLDQIKAVDSHVPVLMISGHGTIEQAMSATRKGAVDFMEKPLSLDLFLSRINEILRIHGTASSHGERDNLHELYEIFIEGSGAMVGIRELIRRAKESGAGVFLSGEIGTGKEVVARAIHKGSPWSRGRFVEIDCTRLTEENFDLLFREALELPSDGRTRPGRQSRSDNVTLYLFEVCEIPLNIQARILRKLQEVQFEVSGTDRGRPRYRIIASSRLDPEKALRKGIFREDLCYLLNVLSIRLPPLRERREDLELLANRLLDLAARNNRLEVRRLSPDAIKALMAYDWPGNFRELRNVTERTTVSMRSTSIEAVDLERLLGGQTEEPEISLVSYTGDLKSAREKFERDYILHVLQKHNFNISRSARQLGIERTNLHRKIKSLKIPLDREAP